MFDEGQIWSVSSDHYILYDDTSSAGVLISVRCSCVLLYVKVGGKRRSKLVRLGSVRKQRQIFEATMVKSSCSWWGEKDWQKMKSDDFTLLHDELPRQRSRLIGISTSHFSIDPTRPEAQHLSYLMVFVRSWIAHLGTSSCLDGHIDKGARLERDWSISFDKQ